MEFEVKSDSSAELPVDNTVVTSCKDSSMAEVVDETAEVTMDVDLEHLGGEKQDKNTANTKAMLAQLKTFALQTELHHTLIQDQESLMFLVYCLGDKSSDIILDSLAILHLLSQKIENRVSLSKTLCIFEALQAVAENKSLTEDVGFATLIYDILKKASVIPQSSRHDKDKQKVKHRRDKPKDPSRKVNRSMTASKPVYLYIPYNIFFKDKRQNITQALQQDRDVLSITFDMNKCLCVIRAKLNAVPESYGKTVANLGYECYLVAQNEKNEEVKVQMKADSQLGDDVYEYLSESDEDKDKSMEDKAVATAADIKNSENKNKGWLASAANFVQKSFYW